MHRLVCVAVLMLVAASRPCLVRGQGKPPDRLAAARAQLRATNLDSAARLVREALDTAAQPTRSEQVEAWLLLGVIEFYKGGDSGTAADFRHALAIDPAVRADGLVRYDTALVVLLDSLRGLAATADTTRPADPVDVVVDCTKTCPENVVLGRLLTFGDLEGARPNEFDAEHARSGQLDLQFIVDTNGRVAPASVRVVMSTLAWKDLEKELVIAMGKARFMPSRADGHVIKVGVAGKIWFTNDRFRWDIPISPRRRPR